MNAEQKPVTNGEQKAIGGVGGGNGVVHEEQRQLKDKVCVNVRGWAVHAADADVFAHVGNLVLGCRCVKTRNWL